MLMQTLASSLNGWDNALGTVSLHSYNEGSLDEGFPQMGTAYDEKLKQVSCERQEGEDDDDDDDDDDEDGHSRARWR